MRRNLLLVALLIAGCASSPTSVAPTVLQVRKPTLDQERQRLAELFRGTPVVLATERDGSLRAEVPLRFCFDARRAVVKPPLAALLDRLAASPATEGAAWKVSAPGDADVKGYTLGMERAASTRDYLVGRGAAAPRFTVSSTDSNAKDAAVRVLITPVAAR
jgi:hypothetical protein